MNWSFQLYSARNFTPWDEVLKTVSGLGYTQVEGFGGVYRDPDAIRAALDANGLTMPTGHFSLDMLETDFDDAMRLADTLGIGMVIVPHIAAEMRPGDSSGWRSFADRLARAEEKCRAQGREFAWHNHDFEFAQLPDGTMPQRIMLDAAPDIGWEIDIAWVIRGGADPVAWIGEYASRIKAVHVKDIAPAGEAADEDGWADVGHGTVDWSAIMKTLREKTPARYFVMEHDNPKDAERFARRSIETVRTL